MRRRSAFTLIELLTIILIIAVVSSVVVPAYARFWSKARFDAAVRNVRDIFAYAREQAVLNDTEAVVTFDGRSQTFAAIVNPPPPLTDLPAALQNTAVGAAPHTAPAPKGVQLGEEFQIADLSSGAQGAASGAGNRATEIRFRGDGTSDGARVVLRSSAGYQATLIVWPATGRITVEALE
jgi:type II secretory pathway pseudopilin PulG